MTTKPFFMAYSITTVGNRTEAEVIQRTPEGWIHLAFRHPLAAAKLVNQMNERLAAFYLEQGWKVAYPTF